MGGFTANHSAISPAILLRQVLARIFHKSHRERPENAMDADSERSETFEEQRKKGRRHIEIFRGTLFAP